MKQRAAGGVVWRRTDSGPEFLVVHRDRYDDWTLPKGKLDKGETEREAAEREVLEETGFRCLVGAPLPLVNYSFDDVDKTVRFFVMEVASGDFEANEEVDRVTWLKGDEAAEMLTYRDSRRLLASIDPTSLMNISRVIVVRHAEAGRRDISDPEDYKRALDENGVRQATIVATRLAEVPVDLIITSPFQRCVQTVEPLAALKELDVEMSDALAEPVERSELGVLVDRVLGSNAVLSTHGDAYPHLVDLFGDYGADFRAPIEWPKASVWVIECHDGVPVFADYTPPPA